MQFSYYLTKNNGQLLIMLEEDKMYKMITNPQPIHKSTFHHSIYKLDNKAILKTLNNQNCGKLNL